MELGGFEPPTSWVRSAPEVKAAIETMRRRRSGPGDLLVFREDSAWRDVCRSSYIDPRVLDRFRDGKTIELPSLAPEGTVTPRRQSLIERRVLELIE